MSIGCYLAVLPLLMSSAEVPTREPGTASSAAIVSTYLDFYNRLHHEPYSNPDKRFLKPAAFSKEDIINAWAEFFRREITALYEDLDIDLRAYHAPRRKSRNPHEAELAKGVAQLLYPSPSHSTLPALIKYHHDHTLLRRTVLAQETIVEQRRMYGSKPTLKERIMIQGPWDEANGPPWRLEGVPAYPMPVKVSTESSLAPFFDHLMHDGGFEVDGPGEEIKEPYYGVEVGRWEKGMLYQDGRMDLCKKVVGPNWIGRLMSSLRGNSFVRHFLLGNNIIGLSGAKQIAAYLDDHPNQIETWYLAGNRIDSDGFAHLTNRFIRSSTITNIWLKRNPLKPESILSVFELITKTKHLQTLDLDQTELSDAGVAELFDMLIELDCPDLPLRNLYLNADGISVAACTSIATYLATPNCTLHSLYVSDNPIGDRGACSLAQGLAANTKLGRLTLRSCGLKSGGVIAIMDALTHHQSIMTLNLSHSYSTEDLDSRYNFFDDEVKDVASDFVKTSQSLRFLDFGITGMTVSGIMEIAQAVEDSHLVVFKAECAYSKLPLTVRQALRASLAKNVKAIYGQNMTYAEFEEGERRWLISPADVRLIDSGYRNRDAGLARRGLMILDKTWREDDEIGRIDDETAHNEESDYSVRAWVGLI